MDDKISIPKLRIKAFKDPTLVPFPTDEPEHLTKFKHFHREINNRRYSIQTLERGDRVKALNKFASQFQVNPVGRYWRVVATSEDIS